MNIVIAYPNLTTSATCLDNQRLKKQLIWLAQIISNILHTTTEYDDILENIKVTKISHDNRRVKDMLMPEIQSNHSTVEWGKKSPLHLAFLLDYHSKCKARVIERRINPSVNLVAISNVFSWFRAYLNEILPLADLTLLYGLDKDLYRNTPSEFDSEKDTITAYQKHLTALWKSDILKYEQYQQEKIAYARLPVTKRYEKPKPRAVRKLLWGRSTTPPEFAKNELKDFTDAARYSA